MVVPMGFVLIWDLGNTANYMKGVFRQTSANISTYFRLFVQDKAGDVVSICILSG